MPWLISFSLGRLPMHLVMFDIDGTLTQTMKVDEECFVRSFKDVFGFADVDTDWSHYPHTTDSGIFHDVFTASRGQPNGMARTAHEWGVVAEVPFTGLRKIEPKSGGQMLGINI